MNPHLKQLLRTPKACLWFAGALAAVWLETVVAQPVLVNSYLPNAVYGQAYAANLMVGGTPAPTSVTVTGLPSGLTAVHNGSGSIAITGKATQAGVFSVQITATNSGGTISPTVPLSVPRYGVVSAVAWNGNTRGCAVVDGGVQCFGEGFADATGTSIATESQPKQLIAAGSGATAIAGSPDDFQYLYPGAHYCAVVNGGVRCWGNNDFGQLGNNSTTDSALPVQTMPAGSNVVAVAVGSYLNEFRQRVAAYACAIVDGGVQCWGRYQTGATGSSLTPTWVVPQNSGATALSANYGHTCAVVGGGVRCWGVHNDYGALGGGLVFPPGSGATAVATGLGHSCAALGGGVQCWGNNAWGQLGAATQYDFSYTPLQAIPPGAGVTSLTGGQLHTCSLINAAHFCWGTAGPYIGYQAIGFGIHRYRVFTETNNLSLIDRIPGSIVDGLAVTRTFDSATPTRGLVPVQALPAGSGVQTLAAASAHTCALASGGVLCWGPSDRRLGALDELSLIRGYGLAEAIGVAGVRHPFLLGEPKHVRLPTVACCVGRTAMRLATSSEREAVRPQHRFGHVPGTYKAKRRVT